MRLATPERLKLLAQKFSCSDFNFALRLRAVKDFKGSRNKVEQNSTMAKDRKLKAALDRYQNVDHNLERQKKLQKKAAKTKKQKQENKVIPQSSDPIVEPTKGERRRSLIEGQLARENEAADAAEAVEAANGGEVGGWVTDESEAAVDEEEGGVTLDVLDDESDSDSELDEGDIDHANNRAKVKVNGDTSEAEDVEEDIPLSDIESLASEEKGDVIPHQRLTINNISALQRSLKSFALPSKLPFSAIQSVTSAEPIHIADVEDDLNRESVFYRQSLEAVKEARVLLKKEGVPFSRPADYFAEMVKSEEQMGKVRQKMVDEAARKKASADARRQRDLKKFGKAVQVAKLQERQKAKTETMDKINALKRSMLRSISIS